jgi:hypothetical protein
MLSISRCAVRARAFLRAATARGNRSGAIDLGTAPDTFSRGQEPVADDGRPRRVIATPVCVVASSRTIDLRERCQPGLLVTLVR